MNGEAFTAADQPYWRSRSWWVRTGRSGVVLLIGTALAFLTSIVVSRALGPLSLGTLALATTTVASIATFLDFSLEEAVVHYGARFIEERRPGAVRALLRTSLRLDAAVGLAVFLSIVVCAGPIASFASGGSLEPFLIRLAAVEVLVTTVNGTTGATLMLGGKPELRSWSMSAASILRFIAVVLAVRAFDGGVDGVLWAYIGAAAIAAGGQFVLARSTARAWGGPREPRRPVRLRALASFGMHSSMTTTIVALRIAVVAVVLGRTSGAASVGLFSVAMLPVIAASVLTAPFRITTFPEMASLAARRHYDTLWQSVREYTRVALVVGTILAAIGYIALPTIIPWLYSEAFVGAVDGARILLVAAVASLATAWAKALPAAIGRPHVRTWVSLGELAVTVASVLALSGHGVVGAAAAVSITSVVAGVAWYVVVARLLRTGDAVPSGSPS